MKRVIWTPVARKSPEETADFLFELWNDQIVDKFLNQLDHRVAQVQKKHELAPTFIESDFRQLIIHKSGSLLYRNSSKYIKFLFIWDNRQDPAQLLEKSADANKR